MTLAVSIATVSAQYQLVEVVTGLSAPLGLAFDGDTLFIAERNANKISKVDITDINPTPIDVDTALNSAAGIILDGNDLYVACLQSVLKTDRSTPSPTADTVVGSLNAWIFSIALDNDDLYVAEFYEDRIINVNVTEPHPATINEVETNIANPFGMLKDGDFLYYTTYGGELYRKDLGQPNSAPILLVSGLSQTMGLLRNGNFLYLAQGHIGPTPNRISRIDLNQNPLIVEDIVLNVPSAPRYLAFNGVNLYVSSQYSGVVSKVEMLQPTMSVLDTVCAGISTSGLGGASPTGGIYSGIGVTDDGNGETFTFDGSVGEGVFTVTYTAAVGGLTATSDIVVSPELTATTSSTDDSGAADGTATATPSGGTAPHVFAWNTSPEQNTATATLLPAGTYEVTITDANGCSTIASVEINGPLVGITNRKPESIYVYPNPADDIVQWDGIKVQLVEIFDNTGRAVMNIAQPNGTVDVSNLTEGIYIMMLHTEEGVCTSRVVKE